MFCYWELFERIEVNVMVRARHLFEFRKPATTRPQREQDLCFFTKVRRRGFSGLVAVVTAISLNTFLLERFATWPLLGSGTWHAESTGSCQRHQTTCLRSSVALCGCTRAACSLTVARRATFPSPASGSTASRTLKIDILLIEFSNEKCSSQRFCIF